MKYHRISTGKVSHLSGMCQQVWCDVLLVVVPHCQEQWHDSPQYEHEQF